MLGLARAGVLLCFARLLSYMVPTLGCVSSASVLLQQLRVGGETIGWVDLCTVVCKMVLDVRRVCIAGSRLVSQLSRLCAMGLYVY